MLNASACSSEQTCTSYKHCMTHKAVLAFQVQGFQPKAPKPCLAALAGPGQAAILDPEAQPPSLALNFSLRRCKCKPLMPDPAGQFSTDREPLAVHCAIHASLNPKP